MVGDGPRKPSGQVRIRIPIRSHDNADGLKAHCCTEDAFGGVAGLDKKSGRALPIGVRRNECVQMRKRGRFVIAVWRIVFLKEMRMMGRNDVQHV
jgi:hypothetical protein